MLSKIGLFGKTMRYIAIPALSKSRAMLSSIPKQHDFNDEEKAFMSAIQQPGAIVDIGDFPDEHKYLVKVGGEIIAGIDDWPRGLVVSQKKLVFLHQDTPAIKSP